MILYNDTAYQLEYNRFTLNTVIQNIIATESRRKKRKLSQHGKLCVEFSTTNKLLSVFVLRDNTLMKNRE